MSEEQTLNEVVEQSLADDPQVDAIDYDSPEYIESVVNEFTDVLGLGGTPPVAAPPEPQAEPQTEQAAPEQTGDQAADVETTEAVETTPPITPKDQSQVIEERANAEAAKRNAELAQKQAIEQARTEAIQEVYKQARLDPVRWAESLAEQGLDIGQVAMAAYRVALGDKAPPELIKRTQKGPDAIMSEMERRLAEQEQKFEQKQRDLELRQIALGYEEYLSAVPESEPYLKAAVAKNRDAVKQNLFNIADAYAQQNGRYPNPRELTAEYNRQLTELAELHGIPLTPSTPAPAAPSSPKVAQPQTKQPQTLSENLSDRAHREAPAEDLSDEALEASAIEWFRSQQPGA